MTTTNQNVTVYRADTQVLQVTLTNADGSPYAPPPGVDMKWRLARSPATFEMHALVRKELGDGIALTATGCDITLVPADTDFPPKLYYHELKIFESAEVATAMVGTFRIKPALRMGELITPASGVVTLDGSAPTVVT